MPASHYYKTDNAIYTPDFTNSKAIRNTYAWKRFQFISTKYNQPTLRYKQRLTSQPSPLKMLKFLININTVIMFAVPVKR